MSSVYSCSDDDDDDVQDPTPDEPIKKSNYKVNDHDKDIEKTVKATTAKGSKDKKSEAKYNMHMVILPSSQWHDIHRITQKFNGHRILQFVRQKKLMDFNSMEAPF